MRVLIASASKHGSTEEIADAIAEELNLAGLDVEFYDAESAPGIGGFDAAVIGSAVYMGRWMAEAREFVELHHEQLREIPVWLFSSGPVGEELLPEGDTPDAQIMSDLTNARGHQTFAGKLNRAELGVGEKLVSKIIRAPEGDFRDWDEIRGWARGIANALVSTRAMSTAS
jgi:menaquinone-dependent protoporphyrinogen oxidase